MERKTYRVGGKLKLNVCENERPICKCHTAEDARLVVIALSTLQDLFIDKVEEPQKCYQYENFPIIDAFHRV